MTVQITIPGVPIWIEAAVGLGTIALAIVALASLRQGRKSVESTLKAVAIADATLHVERERERRRLLDDIALPVLELLRTVSREVYTYPRSNHRYGSISEQVELRGSIEKVRRTR
ncbi:MAG: hypothetical protein O3B31_02715 [Chloroflexi bacterium]|nr:hypothetical protein [Chloroflexota bacterium]